MLSGKLPENRTTPDPPGEDKTRESSVESSEPSDSESDDDGGAGAEGDAAGVDAGSDVVGDVGRRGPGSREPSTAAGTEPSRTARPRTGGKELAAHQQRVRGLKIVLKRGKKRSNEMEETEDPEPARKKTTIKLGKKTSDR